MKYVFLAKLVGPAADLLYGYNDGRWEYLAIDGGDGWKLIRLGDCRPMSPGVRVHRSLEIMRGGSLVEFEDNICG